MAGADGDECDAFDAPWKGGGPWQYLVPAGAASGTSDTSCSGWAYGPLRIREVGAVTNSPRHAGGTEVVIECEATASNLRPAPHLPWSAEEDVVDPLKRANSAAITEDSAPVLNVNAHGALGKLARWRMVPHWDDAQAAVSFVNTMHRTASSAGAENVEEVASYVLVAAWEKESPEMARLFAVNERNLEAIDEHVVGSSGVHIGDEHAHSNENGASGATGIQDVLARCARSFDPLREGAAAGETDGACVTRWFELVETPPKGAAIVDAPRPKMQRKAAAKARASKEAASRFEYDAKWHEYAMPLTDEQVRQFAEEGYLHIRGAVPQRRVHRTLRLINSQMTVQLRGQHESAGTNNSAGTLRKAELELRPLLLESPVLAYAEQLLGKGRVESHLSKAFDEHNYDGQLATTYPRIDSEQGANFPKDVDDDSYLHSMWENQKWHIDGWNRQKRGLSVPNKMPFSVLCGIALTSQSAPANGGLVVYPGSHHVIGAHIARMIAEPQLADLDGDELAAALDGKLPDLKSVAPVKVPMEPGDIVLVHPRVAHRSAPNAGCNVRMTAYFRLKTAECGAVNECNRSLLADPWKDFQGDGVASAGRAAAAAVEAASDGWEAV